MKTTDDAARCAQCGSTRRPNETFCAYCLLQQAVADELPEAPETMEENLDELLSGIEIRDSDWRVGAYDLLEEIGRGGMGVIHRAKHWQNGRVVALKRIVEHQADSPQTLLRFRREIESVARLEHPNILPIYDINETAEGVPYFTMKLAAGGSLESEGAKFKGQPEKCVALLIKIARAVDYAHRLGILHRDLKPGNILLDAGDEPYVSDFGLARWIDENTDLNRTFTMAGTPGFIPPEQVYAPLATIGPAADIYSLGAILFQLLAGRPPFQGETPLGVVRQAADLIAPKLRSFAPQVDRDLETICARCLEREPQARYQSAGELADDLERWQRGGPIHARPVGWPARTWRWARRDPVMAALVAIALVALGAAGVVALQRLSLGRTLDRQAASRRSVAVAPLLDLDQARGDANSADVLTKALQSALASFGNCQVKAITNTPNAFGIGGSPENIRSLTRNVGARTILTGTTRLIDGKRRVSLHLFDRNLGVVLLTREFEMGPNVAGALPKAVRQIAAAFYTALDTGQPMTGREDPAMHNQTAMEFLRAGHEFAARRDQESLDHALSCYQSAIDAAPNSALARSWFVIAAVTRLNVGQYSPALADQAKRIAQEAVALNPRLAAAHRALSGTLRLHNDLRGSLLESTRAIELEGPQFGPVISILASAKALGHPDLALRWIEISRPMQEHPADLESLAGDCWTDLADDARAAVIYRRVAALHPDLPEGWVGLCRLRLLNGENEEARKIYRANVAQFDRFALASEMAAQVEFFGRNFPEAEKRYRALADVDPNGGSGFWGCTGYQSALGRLRQLMGHPAEGSRILRGALDRARNELKVAPQNPEILYRVAAAESSLGQTDQALKRLEMAFHAGWLDYRSLALDPRFDSVRQAPKYLQICEAMKTRVTDLRQSLSEDQRSIRK